MQPAKDCKNEDFGLKYLRRMNAAVLYLETDTLQTLCCLLYEHFFTEEGVCISYEALKSDV